MDTQLKTRAVNAFNYSGRAWQLSQQLPSGSQRQAIEALAEAVRELAQGIEELAKRIS